MHRDHTQHHIRWPRRIRALPVFVESGRANEQACCCFPFRRAKPRPWRRSTAAWYTLRQNLLSHCRLHITHWLNVPATTRPCQRYPGTYRTGSCLDRRIHAMPKSGAGGACSAARRLAALVPNRHCCSASVHRFHVACDRPWPRSRRLRHICSHIILARTLHKRQGYV